MCVFACSSPGAGSKTLAWCACQLKRTIQAIHIAIKMPQQMCSTSASTGFSETSLQLESSHL